jgi:large subunit ribosomal protein L28
MAHVCQITGKRPRIGNTVSHANKKAKRRFNINLHSKRFWSEEQKRFIKLRVSTKGLRIIDKVGVEKVLANLAKYHSDITG